MGRVLPHIDGAGAFGRALANDEMRADMTNVLLVEDDEGFRRDIRDLLLARNAGLRVVEAGNGMEALGEINRQRPSLVLLEIKLPDFNGLVLTRHIRQTYGDIPVVILSGLDMLEYYQAAQESGASAFISKRKEFVTENVIACVEDILNS